MKTNYPLCFIYGVLYMLFLYSPTVFGKEFAISDHIGSITTINPENATCNQLEPLVNNAKFDHLTAETIPLGGLCIPIIGDVDKLVDTNLNSPTNLSLTGLGCEVELGVKDSDHSYPSGTFAGFKVSGAGLLQASIGASVEISTYRNGAFVEKKTVVSETIGLTTSLLDADGNIVLGFVTTKGFDEIRIKYESLLNVLFSAQVYHPVIKKFCEGPALNCNEPKALKAPDFPVVINNTNTGIEGVLCASCVVSDAENVISSNDFDFATIDLTVGVVAAGSIAVKDQLGSYPSGTFAGFDIGNTTLLGVELLNAITITTYEDGILKESKTGVDNLLSVNSFLLEGNGRQVVGFVSSDSFDEVKITIANTLAVNVGATKVFKAVVEKFCELGIGCNETYFLNDGVDGFPVVVSSEKTGTGGIACVGCSIDNTRYVISPNPQDYASLKMAVGVSGINSISVKNVLSNYPIGSVAGYAIEDLQGLLEVDLLNSLTVSTYLDGNYQESASGLDLLQLTVLVDIIGSSAGRYNIGFETSKPYNEIKISVSSLVSVENDLRVFGAFVDTSIANDPANGFDCLDTTAPSLDITLADTTLSIGDTTEVTFTFSEEIKEFDTTDITADNGTISNLVITADSTVWKATFTPNEDVESDTNTISVGTDYTDKMGNKGASADSPNYIIDTKAPTVPTVESQITNDTTPVLNGTAEVGTTIDVTVGGATYITTADGSGKWSINTETATPDSGVFNPDVNGENEVDVTSTDAAGNSTSDTTTLELTIDTTAPVVPTVESQITNDTTPVLNGTAEAGTTIDVTVGGATYVTTADGSGNWSINTETATPDSGAFNPDVNGENEVEVISTDAAGNSTSDNTTLELTIDTTAPVVPTVESQITNDTTPVLNGTAEAGTTVDVTVGGATYITTADGSGKWSINTETATPDSGVFNPNVNGENEVDVTSTDAAGNSTSDNTTLELTIDTTSPVVPTVESQITNDTTPVLNGTAEVGTTVDVTVGGATYITTADGSGNWSIDTETATPDSGAFNPDVNGENEIVVTSTDAAGNSTSDTTTLELTIDTTAPVVPTVESQITNDTTPVLIGTAEAGNTIDVTVGGATYITTADGSGNWIIDTETATPDSGVFNPNVNGENEVEVTSTDAAGNSTSDTTTLELTIDTTAPVVPTVESQITKNTTPVLKGTAEAGTTVNVTVGGATYITNTDGSGNWNIDTETATPDSGVFNPDVNGENEVEVTSTDAAGNSTSDNTTLELTIDTTAPVVPTVESQITNDTTPVLKGTAEVGTTVDVAVGGTTYITTADGSGNWSINTETATPDSGVFNPNVNGENEVEVISTDAAGNSTSDNTTLELTIDTTAPVVPTVESQITNDTTPVLNGTAEAGTTVDVTVGGATYITTADGSGKWSINTETATPDSGVFNPDVNGENEVEVISTDAAGNSTSDNTTLELTIDTTAPVVPTVESQITNDTTPVLNGTAEAGTTIDVTVGGATYITTADGSGNWSINTETATPDSGVFNPNVNGENEVDVTSTDAAGNSTSDTTTLELTIDTTAPVVPTVESQITNDTTPVLNGTAEAGTTVDVTVGGATYITTADGSGNWSIDTETATPDSGVFNLDVNGENEVDVTSTDAAGNSTSDNTTLELTIDTTAPVVPTVESQITNDTTPVLNGTAEAGTTVDVTVGGATYITTADGSGNWNIDTETATTDDGVFNPDVNGANEVVVISTDVAGNSTSDTTTLELIIDTTAPLSPVIIKVIEDTEIPNDGITTDKTVLIVGEAEPETTIEVFIDGLSLGKTTADINGNWIFDNTNTVLNDGLYSIEARSEDAAGNISPYSDEFVLEIVTTDLDSDDDGLTDEEEAIIGTDPFNPDTDGDTIKDGQEVSDGTNPLDGCDSIGGTPPAGSNCDISINHDVIDSNHNDGRFEIDNIERFPNNSVQIYNRWGVLVYETKGYDNSVNVFTGTSNGRSVVNKNKALPAGVYFYIIKYLNKDVAKTKSGYIYINR